MKKKRFYVIQLPWEPNGEKLFFLAENDTQAEEMLLKMLNRYEDVCKHEDFKNGKCVECELECDHQEIEENHCLDCGEYVEPFDPRCEPEYMEDR